MTEKIKDNSKRANRLISILKIYLGLSIIDLLFGFYQYKVWSNHDFNPILDSWDAEYDFPNAIAFDIIYGVFWLVFLPIMIVTFIRFIKWFRRAYCNLNRLGIKTDKKEGWAAGAWFIPFYNLVAPYLIMKEIWNKTQKYYKENTEDTNILGVWWALWVAANIITNQGDGIGASFLGEGLEIQTIIIIIADILWIPATYVTINLIKKVSFFEKEMYEKAVNTNNEEINEVVFKETVQQS